jgi:hypothetical protein
VGISESDGILAAERQQHPSSGISAGGPAVEHRGLPLARLAPYVRQPPRHGRGRPPDDPGTHGSQDVGDDPALCPSLADALPRCRQAAGLPFLGTNRHSTGTGSGEVRGDEPPSPRNYESG